MEREPADALNSQWQQCNEINAAYTRPWTLVFFIWFVQYAIQCKKFFFFQCTFYSTRSHLFMPPKELWHFICWRFKKKKKPMTKPGEIVGCSRSACADMLLTPPLTEAMNYMNTTLQKSLLLRHTGCTGALHCWVKAPFSTLKYF